MAEVDLLNHYGLQSLNPQRWPEGLFDDAWSLEEDESKLRSTANARRRMTTLGRAPSLVDAPRSIAMVQKDEPDPLGTSQSVVRALRSRGLPVEKNVRLRNTFLLSSVTFNPSSYLSEVHNDASTDDLIRGLDYLSNSIEQKSASLKVLVESNFERFLRAKATIDNVYKEMREHGAEPERPVSKPVHSRISSRTVPRFRSASNNYGSPPPPSPQNRAAFISEKRRYALAKETEYGTMGIRMPLLEAAAKADDIWGPAMGDKSTEEELKSILDSLEQNKELFAHASAIDDCVHRNDYQGMAAEYAKVEKYASEARAIGDRSQRQGQRLPDSDLHQMIITARIWLDVQSTMETVKRNLWTKLLNAHSSTISNASSTVDDPMDLITTLLQMRVSENPISAWIRSHQEHLQYKITSTFERSRIEIEIMRRRLLTNGKPNTKTLATHLKTAKQTNSDEVALDLDTAPVLRFWDKVESSLEMLLSAKVGLLAEVLEFGETVQGFIDGKKQRALPSSAFGQGHQHLHLSSEETTSFQRITSSLIGQIRDQLQRFFLEEPVRDVSSLFSPIPPTPSTPMTPGTTPSRMTKFNFRPQDIPPPSPKIGESWENLAFWPPYGNSLSASVVLDRLLSTVAVAAAEIVSVSGIEQDENIIPSIRILVSDVRERFSTAACAAWIADAENCRELEDWSKSPEKSDVTNMPAYFSAWESAMLTNLQKIVYIPDSPSTSSSVVQPPPTRHVETVQRAFRNSLYKAFDGMMQFARRPSTDTGGGGGDDLTNASINSRASSTSATAGNAFNARDVNTRKLLTISNYQHLRTTVVPNLVTLFEAHFSTTIANDARVLRDSLSQMSSQVFKSYVKPTLTHVDFLIHAGISDHDYTTASGGRKPDNAKPYVFETLGSLVVLHTDVSATTPGLTSQILSHCLEHISSTLVEAFSKKSGPFPLPTLTQATLDVEFLAQTLNSYTTDRCSEIQGKIYLAMDEKTDNESRLALQKELPEMRAVLKRLRETTRGAFGCFRRVRKPGTRGEEVVPGGSAGRGRTEGSR